MKIKVSFLDQFHKVLSEKTIGPNELVLMPKSGFYVRIEVLADEQ